MKQVLLGLIVGVLAGALILGGVLVATGQFVSAPSAVGLNEIASNGNVQGRLYTGNPANEAQLVAKEDERLDYLRTVTSAAQWQFENATAPYRIQTGERSTLVLTASDEPYTLVDLGEFLGDGLVLLDTGALLLMESIVVMPGATLEIRPETEVALLLDSTSTSFVSILSLGGTLDFRGSIAAPIAIASWDSTRQRADIVTNDGRSYVRAIGGTVNLGYAFFADLGFWSGSTGGVSISGSSTVPAAEVAAAGEASEEGETQLGEPTPQPAGAPLLPEAEVDAFALDHGKVTAAVAVDIEQVSFLRNAFGLFITESSDVVLDWVVVEGSLIDGLVLHRFVSGAVVTNTTSTGNAVDGITVSRSSDDIEFRDVTAADNGRNGLTIDGTPLADGPSALGSTVAPYGEFTVTAGEFSDNGRYGIELAGVQNATVARNLVERNDIGIVTTGLAADVTIHDNTFTDQVRQSVALRDGATDVTVSGNAIGGGDTGVYVRNAEATVSDNTFSSITNHGVTLVGEDTTARVLNNSIGGSGTTPIHRDAATTASVVSGNQTLDWKPQVTPATVAKSLFQPLTIVWLSLALLLVFTAVLRTRRRTNTIIDPYANVAPLSSFTRGIVSPLGENKGG